MKTTCFSFGQSHVHRVNGVTFDADCLVEITAKDPRQVMFDTFGDKWAMEYTPERAKECLKFYKRGIIKL